MGRPRKKRKAKEIKLNVRVNPIYKPALYNQDRYLFLFGGAGSGKSDFAVFKMLYRLVNEENHKFLFVRKVSKTIKESLFELTRQVINRDFAPLAKYFKINKTDYSFEFIPNGNRIISTGMDDEEKIKSVAGVTGILIEEITELDINDYLQLDMRLRGKTSHYKQIISMFNPVSDEHWLKDFVEPDDIPLTKELDGKRWRFTRPTGEGKEELFTTVYNTTFEDNKYLDAQYKAVLEAKARQSPTAYIVYKLGRWGQPEDGGYIKREYFEILNPMQMPTEFWSVPKIFVADLAFTKNEKNDPNGVLCFRVYKNRLYLVDYIYYWEDFENNKLKLKSFVEGHGNIYAPLWIENKATGLPMIDSLITNYGMNARQFKVGSKDKLARLKSVLHFIDSGRVKIIKGAWNYERFINQCIVFDGTGKVHDEEVDCLVMAVKVGLESGHAHPNRRRTMRRIRAIG